MFDFAEPEALIMSFVPVPPLLRRHYRLQLSSSRPLFVATASDSESSENKNNDGVTPVDWRAFRARLVELERCKDGATSIPSPSGSSSSTPSSSTSPEQSTSSNRWVHEVGAIEQGCLLIASPSHFGTRQQYFAQTVIFVLDHSASTGTVGVILNRPLSYSLSEVPISGDAESSWASVLRRPTFAKAPLYLGGPMEQGRLVLIHGDSNTEGSTRIIDGVYAGGLPSALDRVAKGELGGDELRLFSGYAGWGPGQLESEVTQGVWFVAAGSTDIVLQHCVNLPRPLWKQVLDHMGGKYSEISKRLDELDEGKYSI